MAFIDGAGTGVLRGLRFTGSGVVGEVTVTPLSPEHEGYSETGHLFFRVDITSLVDADVEIQVSSVDTFASTVWTTTLVNLSPGEYNVLPTGLTPGSTYYWRMRAGEAGSGIFGDWVLYGAGVPILNYTDISLSSAFASTTLGGYPASNFIDGNINTFWHVSGAPPQHFGAEATAAEPRRVRIAPRHDISATARSMNDFTVEGSNDGVTYTVIETFTDVTDWVAGVFSEFELPASGPWDYLRVQYTSHNGSTAVAIAELDFQEATPGSSPGEPLSFLYAPGRSEAHEYTYINVGALGIPSPDAGEYVYLNVGFESVLSPDGGEYIYLNVGFEVTLNQDGHSYIYLGDIDENTPHPHIWWLYPAGGREGDGIKIVGYGFGHTQVEYDGVVEIDWGGTLGWQPIAHVSWQTIVAGSDAYTEDRRISEFLNLSDPEHQIVEIIVPPDAIPPGYPIRIRTDGP